METFASSLNTLDMTLKEQTGSWLCPWLSVVYLPAALCGYAQLHTVDGESHSFCRLQPFAALLAGPYAVLADIFLGKMKQKDAANDTASSEGPKRRTSQGF